MQTNTKERNEGRINDCKNGIEDLIVKYGKEPIDDLKDVDKIARQEEHIIEKTGRDIDKYVKKGRKKAEK